MALQEIKGSVVLVTGANRGIGKAYVDSLLKRGAKKIYAGVRNMETTDVFKSEVVIPVHIDITDLTLVAKASEICKDVNLLINNAGICHFVRTIEAARDEFETNCLGTWAMCQAFAPVLAENGGGAIANMLSTGAMVNFPTLGSYSVSKAAAQSMTQMFRGLLASQGTLVMSIFSGPAETDLMKDVEMPKVPPSHIADAVLDSVVKGIEDVYPDDYSAQLRDSILADPKGTEKQAGMYI